MVGTVSFIDEHDNLAYVTVVNRSKGYSVSFIGKRNDCRNAKPQRVDVGEIVEFDVREEKRNGYKRRFARNLRILTGREEKRALACC